MAAHEQLSQFPKIYETATYKNPALAPANVAHSTASLMNLYLHGELTDPNLARWYLSGNTLDFLWNTERGFFRNLGKIDRTGKIEPEDLSRLQAIARQNPESFDPEVDEAFGFSLVTFSHMPEMATSIYLPKGFSRRGILAPPFTTREYFLRIRELRHEVIRIINGETHPRVIMELYPPLWRTYLFFEAGKDIPLRQQENPEEAKRKTSELLDHLLEGVKIDL